MASPSDEKRPRFYAPSRDAGVRPLLQRYHRVWQICVSAVIGLLLLFHFLDLVPPRSYPAPEFSDNDTFRAPRKNIWADLEREEVVDLLKFLHADPNPLNLTAAANATR